jgi:hypothetical protein
MNRTGLRKNSYTPRERAASQSIEPIRLLRKPYLKGAFWIDPKDFSFNPYKTVEYALAQDIQKIREINDAWLDCGALADTSADKVMQRVYQLMNEKIKTFKKA